MKCCVPARVYNFRISSRRHNHQRMSETQLTTNSMHECTHKNNNEGKKSGKIPCELKHTSQKPQMEKEISCGPGKKEQFIYPARLKQFNLL